ncbi:IucA/IucC family siderophore biosynthesis protein [Aeromicrobium sp. CnD17-E]|uniref:IucA/IucC family protein n=1 Tax=Aeromicrobium sp. CnD17-E TaxID=2954487 RepID=UPI002097AC88|nr:IucA/IucC family protein [Aeromicrobium sp. CnD17-E]MCO7240260.1 IucA/IucC family siderophore biosynthesis protein [Aeromicrobium sp. CnD17-E]
MSTVVDLHATSQQAFDAADHLEPATLERAQRRLAAKALGELTHERLLSPTPVPDAAGWWEVRTVASVWRFHAHVHEPEHWSVDPASLLRADVEQDVTRPVDVLELVAELHDELGIPEHLVAVYLEELSATLAAACWSDVHHDHSVEDLLDADLATTEAAMHEGHPAFIATNGRIGYGLDDYRAYAPETGSEVHLVWLAVRREHTVLAVGDGLDEETLYAGELDADERAGFELRLRSLGLEPRDYLLVPAHPWQWTNKLAITFAADVARRDVVPLGPGRDAYRAQQSVRTFLNVSDPSRFYVKTALSVQNMGFMRGLSPHYMRGTPAINDWVHRLVADDAELRRCGFEVLRERAAVGYTGGVYQQVAGVRRGPYQKMFAALWRETPTLAAGERAATMASLLHRDRDGRSLVAATVRASGLDPADWVRRYLDVYLRPVAHCLWAHDLAFMPHGENLILVLRGHVPVRAYMKDVGEEVALLVGDGPEAHPEHELPEAVRRIRATVPEGQQSLAVLTDVLDGFLRFLAAILADDGVLPGSDFWAVAAECLRDLQADHPELADQHARYDLLAPDFEHSCLNRLQLRNTLEMVDLADQATSLQLVGRLTNPLHGR